MSAQRRLVFQLGSNNWQSSEEFAPGSGILHEGHHRTFNQLADVTAVSMFPSRVQKSVRRDVSVFELEHDIPICESVSPTSSYRWHSMSDAEFDAYRRRLCCAVFEYMATVEDAEGGMFSLAVAHHTFLNPLVMRDVMRMRLEQSRPAMPLLCFVHGTALKMFAYEKSGRDPRSFPPRFLPMIEREGLFDGSLNRAASGPGQQVDVCAAISEQQISALLEIFPQFPRERILLSPNGYDQDVFRRLADPRDVYADRDRVLAEFVTEPYAGSSRRPEPVCSEGGFDRVVIFCGKFADWKRLDALLHAAAIYERCGSKVATLVVGSGPHEAQVRLQDLAQKELGLRHVYFLGARQQDELAVLYNAADVGCFPSYQEPFGLVFIECMACGTPVIGADSGGPKDFVSDEVGTLVAETDDRAVLAGVLAATIRRALSEDWKATKGPAAARLVASRFSLRRQCTSLLAGVDRVLARGVRGAAGAVAWGRHVA